jgi:hypothetical protein
MAGPEWAEGHYDMQPNLVDIGLGVLARDYKFLSNVQPSPIFLREPKNSR